MARLSDRTTGEIMILAVTFTVCFSILASGLTVAVISIVHPDADVSVWLSRIAGILNTMIGLLAGFLAGRTDVMMGSKAPPPSPSAASEETP